MEKVARPAQRGHRQIQHRHLLLAQLAGQDTANLASTDIIWSPSAQQACRRHWLLEKSLATLMPLQPGEDRQVFLWQRHRKLSA